MYFADLSLLRSHSGPYDAANWQVPLLAIGWLEHPHSYHKGSRSSGLEAKILYLVEQAKVNRPHETFRGQHRCSLCEAEGHRRDNLPDSHHNLFIPGTSVIYVAPAGIIHYLRHHLYQPVRDFAEAVDRCPDYGTPVYFAVLKATNHGCITPFEVQEEQARGIRSVPLKISEARQQPTS